WRRLLENSLSAKVSCWLIRLLILGSGYNTMISHLGLIRTFPKKNHSRVKQAVFVEKENTRSQKGFFYQKCIDENSLIRFNAPRCPDSSVGRAGD
ncbi:hypothetical protein, partial [Providencia rustigianii]|uniref:hypothetical protein n=1 Tax=Providencia rustigianii TaxID=158850 RepID=UPI002240A52B